MSRKDGIDAWAQEVKEGLAVEPTGRRPPQFAWHPASAALCLRPRTRGNPRVEWEASFEGQGGSVDGAFGCRVCFGANTGHMA